MKHNYIKQSNMLELAAYQRELYQRPRLRYLFLELTDQCNLNCAHCGSKCTGSNHTYLPISAVERTLRSVARAYNPSGILVCITGGEPTLHPQLVEIVQMCHQLGFRNGITSNGTRIDRAMALQLRNAGLDTISISIDGIGPVHDAFRGREGAYDDALRGIDTLKSSGIEPEAMTVVHSNNYDQLNDIYAMLLGLDIYSWRLINVDPIGRAAMNERMLLTPNQLRGLYEFIRSRRFDPDNNMEVTYSCSHYVTMEYENEIRNYYFQCGAGTMVGSVMANGDIGACLDIERRPDLIQGNIYRDDFVDVWENQFKAFRRDRARESEFCKGCSDRRYCMGDSAHTWDYDRNEPRYCVARMMEVTDAN